MTQNQIKNQVLDEIIKQLEKGTVPWKQPWFSISKCNLMTGHVYRGTNRILLSNFSDQFYLTFNQTNQLGGHVKKGEKSKLVIFWKFSNRIEKDENGNEEIKQNAPLIKTYRVFGLSQIEGIEPDILEKRIQKSNMILKENKINMDIDTFIDATHAQIEHTDQTKAFYAPGIDLINMPQLGQFENSDAYYTTLFHELTHWTGHENRCKRDLKNNYNANSYGKEELVAELGSALIANEFKINRIKENAAYLENWLSAIRENKNILFSSATKAEEAINYLKKLVA